jgi:DNA helicase-2/ATP-dependent DNA helicase PcrA
MENNMSAVMEGLNSEQRNAVSCVEGPVLIVAGAGSGKTKVLISRIAYIMEKGCEPDKILALTFTKKAATEMKDRIGAMVGQRKANRLYMGTFHSIFAKLLREFADRLAYPSSFQIYDTSDSTSLIKTCIKDLQLDDKIYKPKDVLARISKAKNNLVTAEAYRSNPTAIKDDTIAKKPKICDIYSLYSSRCKQAGVMDFDDILLNMNILIRDHKDALMSIADRFEYILVDEYQDTNFAQYLILKKLCLNHRNICVVGDDSQSIYGFRGARIENILNFRKDYPESKIFRLERNYRSTQMIVNAANSLIEKNANRIPKNCVSCQDEGEKIRLVKAYTEQEEGLLIASAIIDRMQKEHAQYQDFAILYRTNNQSRSLEEALRKRNLPYIIYSGHAFFDRKEVKDMLSYLKLAVNVQDSEAFKRVVNEPARGIGDTSLNALSTAANAHKVSLFKAAFMDDLENYGLKPAAIEKIRSFCFMIDKAASKIKDTQAYDIARSLAEESGLLASYRNENTIESQGKLANVEELLNSIASFKEDREEEYKEQMLADDADMSTLLPIVTLDEYLEDITLASTVDMTDDEDAHNRISLMTVHSAKGLEFPYVFVSGMEDNLFPSGGMFTTPSELEEERRLFYVALTRAKRVVTLTYSQSRMKNGKHESSAPSRFLREIAPEYLANPLSKEDDQIPEENDGFHFGSGSNHFNGKFGMGDKSSGQYRTDYGHRQSQYGSRQDTGSSAPVTSTPYGSSSSVSSAKEMLRNRPLPPKSTDSNFVPMDADQFKVGQRIEHNRFGTGLIEEITGSVPDLKARVKFDIYGEKILLLKYAKMRLEQ